MQRFDHRVLVCHLVQSMHTYGSWVGETHIQKCSMFLQKLLGVPIDYRFVLYKHGPYSFDLRADLAEMRVRYLLDVKPHPRYAPSYVLGVRGERSVELKNEFEKEIRFVSEEVSTKNVAELERIATVYFIHEAHPELAENEVANLVCELKPHIQPSDANLAFEEVRRIVMTADEQGLAHSAIAA